MRVASTRPASFRFHFVSNNHGFRSFSSFESPLLCFSEKMEKRVYAGTKLSHSFAASPQQAPQPPKPAGTARPPPPPPPDRALRPLPRRQGSHPPPSARGEPKTTDTNSK
ncbi:formin-like protein 10 [Pimephales promelas]|uniref:formin-like protein 10 n=1 Tax=Pimephales promelas TaxID=90988 RepID=UPI001955BEE5|nr:formin-like protein 10 [Pimephales promelas]